MGSFGQMLRQAFAAFTTFFGALEKTAKAADHLATWAEESAGAFADEARISREQRKRELEANLNKTTRQLTKAA